MRSTTTPGATAGHSQSPDVRPPRTRDAGLKPSRQTPPSTWPCDAVDEPHRSASKERRVAKDCGRNHSMYDGLRARKPVGRVEREQIPLASGPPEQSSPPKRQIRQGFVLARGNEGRMALRLNGMRTSTSNKLRSLLARRECGRCTDCEA
ncbi:hypothetical protein OH76DRAFT_101336 [Lentinus brumalis]|uniref:Uncharacterized protein n=1 Tax=Lentinus brumalis TaxID=2498619 RepID=A0A371CQ75_9APHY|nr:hypothetical protein OH76DRAFT_101336 [Polyporus brumalis]